MYDNQTRTLTSDSVRMGGEKTRSILTVGFTEAKGLEVVSVGTCTFEASFDVFTKLATRPDVITFIYIFTCLQNTTASGFSCWELIKAAEEQNQ